LPKYKEELENLNRFYFLTTGQIEMFMREL